MTLRLQFRLHIIQNVNHDHRVSDDVDQGLCYDIFMPYNYCFSLLLEYLYDDRKPHRISLSHQHYYHYLCTALVLYPHCSPGRLTSHYSTSLSVLLIVAVQLYGTHL
jgi:hypothetical protein